MSLMTVRDLRQAIANLDASLPLTAILDRGDKPFELLNIETVDVHSGTPTRDKDTYAPGFKFESPGVAKWAFLTVMRESGD